MTRTHQFARFIRTYDQLRIVAPTLTADQIAELRSILDKALTPSAYAVQRAKDRFGRDGVNLGGSRRAS